MHEVKVTVGPDGKARLEFSGFEGATCLVTGDDLSKLLGQLGIELDQTGFEPKPELLVAEETGEVLPERTRQTNHQ